MLPSVLNNRRPVAMASVDLAIHHPRKLEDANLVFPFPLFPQR